MIAAGLTKPNGPKCKAVEFVAFAFIEKKLKKNHFMFFTIFQTFTIVMIAIRQITHYAARHKIREDRPSVRKAIEHYCFSSLWMLYCEPADSFMPSEVRCPITPLPPCYNNLNNTGSTNSLVVSTSCYAVNFECLIRCSYKLCHLC